MGPEGAIGPDSEHNRKVTKRILGALGIKNLRREGKAMDMYHAKIQVEVRRVAGKLGEAVVDVAGPSALLLNGLATLIWKLAKEIGWDPEDLCDAMKRTMREDRMEIGGRDRQ